MDNLQFWFQQIDRWVKNPKEFNPSDYYLEFEDGTTLAALLALSED